LLRKMLDNFNESRSKSYYRIAATVLELDELHGALSGAREESGGLDVRARSKALHRILDEIAARRDYLFELRK